MTRPVSRRRFLRLGLGALASAASTACLGAAYATRIEPQWLQLTTTEVHLPNLPIALDGLSVALLSDLHVGPYVGPEIVRRAVAVANESAADLSLVAGDFVSQSAGYAAACAAELKALRSSYGTFAVLGNHDVWTGAEHVASEVRAAGIQVLRNERTSIQVGRSRLWLIGVEDTGYVGRRFASFQARWAATARALMALLEECPADEPRLLLVHNPDFTEMALPGGVDLAMCGHTHGGQVRLPIAGPPVVPSCFGRKYAAGLVPGPATLVYVTRGVGLIAPPVRVNCRPEVSLLRLRGPRA